MSDLQFNEYNCICGTRTFLKKDGTPWKHQTPQGAHCFGSSDPVYEPDPEDSGDKKFEYSILVYASNPMIHEEEWQYMNRVLATEAAAESGYYPMAEAVLKSQTPEGPKIRFTYEVPVQEG